jgi:hypothetical protein
MEEPMKTQIHNIAERPEILELVKEIHKTVTTDRREYAEALKWLMSPTKNDKIRDEILRRLERIISQTREKEARKPKSDNIDEVIEIWAEAIGENAIWVKLLKRLRLLGGTIKWYSGIPRVDLYSDFELYGLEGERLSFQSRLQDIKEAIEKLRAMQPDLAAREGA